MKIRNFSGLDCSFGYNVTSKKIQTARNIINQITAPVRRATPGERKALSRALGIESLSSKNWQTKFESHKGDIIGGEILPNISVTAKGISPMDAVGNIINVELARIKGQLKKISPEDLII